MHRNQFNFSRFSIASIFSLKSIPDVNLEHNNQSQCKYCIISYCNIIPCTPPTKFVTEAVVSLIVLGPKTVILGNTLAQLPW